MATNYRNGLLAAVHEAAEDLHAVGAIDKRTMREFDARCLTPVPKLSPDEIRTLRDNEFISQTVLARHLNVTPGLISQWERGEKRPGGAALKLLDIVARKGLEALL